MYLNIYLMHIHFASAGAGREEGAFSRLGLPELHGIFLR
jgi:hypothetical protein